MKFKMIFIAAVATVGFTQCAQQQAASVTKVSEPKYEINVNPDIISIRYDDDLLRQAKAAYEAKEPAFMKLFTPFQQMVEERYMKHPAVSVVDDFKHLPPSGDPRDYMTPSPYWFPDPDTEDGLPYVRSDGVVNPWVYEFAGNTVGNIMASGCDNLAFLYYITGDEKYAAKSAEFIRTWYLDPERGMNPNIVFAQYVPGMKRIRGTGLLESDRSVLAFNAAKMIGDSEWWTAEDEAALQDWAKAYLYWMEYSTHGQEEGRGGNNHAMWYESNREAIALYTKDYDHLAKIIYEGLYPHLSGQVAADSTMPHEVARTRSLHYMAYTLTAVVQSSIVARKIGINDVWTHTGPNGRGLSWVINHLVPYWKDPDSWPYQQITLLSDIQVPAILYQFGKETNDQKYLDVASEVSMGKITNYGTNSNNIVTILHYKFRP